MKLIQNSASDLLVEKLLANLSLTARQNRLKPL